MSIRKDEPLFLSLFCLIVLSLFVACTSCAPALSEKDTMHSYTPEAWSMVQPARAVLYIKENRIRLAGSAVVVRCEKGKPIRLLTANHVPDAIREVDGSLDAPILVGSNDTGRYQQVKVVYARPGWDLAVLEGYVPEERSCPAAPIATSLPDIGATVWLVGNPLRHEGNITKGILSNVYYSSGQWKEDPMVYRFDAAAAPGNSGGPLYNDRGEVIGILSYGEIVFFGFISGGGHAIALPHLWIVLKHVDKPVKAPASQPDAGTPGD